MPPVLDGAVGRWSVFDCSVYALHANAKMKANAPMDATSAYAMCVHVVIRSVMGVMSGAAAAGNGMSATS